MGEPLFLIIEASDRKFGVALSRGPNVLTERMSEANVSHSAAMAPLIKEVLLDNKESIIDVNAVIVCSGPGSYTGLRGSYALAKGITIGLDIPMISVSAHDALFHEAANKSESAEIFITTVDARRMETSSVCYESGGKVLWRNQSMIWDDKTIKEYKQTDRRTCILGSGVRKLRHHLDGSPSLSFDLEELRPSFLIREALRKYEEKAYENIFSATPEYFKPPNITTSKKPLL